MSRPKLTKRQTLLREDEIMRQRHAGVPISVIATAVTPPITERSVIRSYNRALARNFPPDLQRAEVLRALMVCDEQIRRSRARLQVPHPVRNAKGEALVDSQGELIPDLDVESRIEAEISRVEDRRARIAGTFAPAKHAVTVLTADDLAPLLTEWTTRLSPDELEEAKRRALAIDVTALPAAVEV